MKIKKFLVAIPLCACLLFGTTACTPNNDGDNPLNPDSSQLNQTQTDYKEPINTAEKTRSEIVSDVVATVASVYICSGESEKFSGSGVAVYAGGYIATNWHVIQSVISNPVSNSIKLEFEVDGDYKKYNAEILWSNINFDLAVLKCEYANIPFVKMQDRWIEDENRLKIAEEVWTLGTPFNEGLHATYSQGYISSEQERTSVSSSRVYESLIQHSAPISNGSSGSALFDAAGNLIGLNTLGINSSSSNAANSLFFATPIYPIQNIIDDIANSYTYGQTYSFPAIGVSGYDSYMSKYYSDVDSFEDKGIYASEISNPGPCLGKLKTGDFIVGICSTDNISTNSEDYVQIDKRNDLLYALSKYKKGDSVAIFYKRGVTNGYVTITLN